MLTSKQARTWSSSSPISPDRKSTRLNSSHLVISYAVFCLKKKKKNVDVHVVAGEGVFELRGHAGGPLDSRTIRHPPVYWHIDNDAHVQCMSTHTRNVAAD